MRGMNLYQLLHPPVDLPSIRTRRTPHAIFLVMEIRDLSVVLS